MAPAGEFIAAMVAREQGFFKKRRLDVDLQIDAARCHRAGASVAAVFVYDMEAMRTTGKARAGPSSLLGVTTHCGLARNFGAGN